ATAAVTGVELVAARSPYLAYQLDASARHSPPNGSLAAGVLRTAWWGLRRRAGGATRDRLPLALTVTALAFAALFFVRVNYVSAHSGLVRAIVSLDRASGAVMWTVQGLEGPQPAIDGRNSPATPSPVTDGRIVCGFFCSPGLLCATTTGERVWTRTDLPYEGLYGAGFSPVLLDGLLIPRAHAPTRLSTAPR